MLQLVKKLFFRLRRPTQGRTQTKFKGKLLSHAILRNMKHNIKEFTRRNKAACVSWKFHYRDEKPGIPVTPRVARRVFWNSAFCLDKSGAKRAIDYSIDRY